MLMVFNRASLLFFNIMEENKFLLKIKSLEQYTAEFIVN